MSTYTILVLVQWFLHDSFKGQEKERFVLNTFGKNNRKNAKCVCVCGWGVGVGVWVCMYNEQTLLFAWFTVLSIFRLFPSISAYVSTR